MQKLELTSENIYAVGDLHGKFETLKWFIKQNDIQDSIIICCGDIGLGFNKPSSDEQALKKAFSKILRENKCHVVMFRGNHDNPERFTNNMVKINNLHIIPDYTLVSVENSEGEKINILCIGGGLSIDRSNRVKRYDEMVEQYKRYHPGATLNEIKENVPQNYWSNELPVYDEGKLDEITKTNENIDVVCTHCAPSFCEPLSKDGLKYWTVQDGALLADSEAERGVMDKVFNKLKNAGKTPKKWVYGHYHYTNTSYIEDIKFKMLDMVYDYVGDYEVIR